MKKTKLIALVLAALLSMGALASCSSEGNKAAEDSSVATEKADTNETQAEENENGSDTAEAIDTTIEGAIQEDASSVEQGMETITFGRYEQDNDTANGAEEIEWIVLTKEDGKALVISKYALDCQLYNEDYVDITWENCTLRAWLNDKFYNTAFSEEEKGNIETSNIVNDDNSTYGTEGGNDTSDKVFLLSIDEAEEYFSSDEARCCKPTVYAVSQGAYVNESYDGNCVWWLRSPSRDTDCAATVDLDGSVFDFGYYVNFSDRAVRPAMWVNLEA